MNIQNYLIGDSYAHIFGTVARTNCSEKNSMIVLKVARKCLDDVKMLVMFGQPKLGHRGKVERVTARPEVGSRRVKSIV